MQPLYLTRIEDLRHGDLVKVDCAGCHHAGRSPIGGITGSAAVPDPGLARACVKAVRIQRGEGGADTEGRRAPSVLPICFRGDADEVLSGVYDILSY
jgi:hypothetical protein